MLLKPKTIETPSAPAFYPEGYNSQQQLGFAGIEQMLTRAGFDEIRFLVRGR
jgi:hypothetical protein